MTPSPFAGQGVDALRTAARRRLPRFLFDYLDGGAGSEGTLSANTAALSALSIRQQVLRDVSKVTTRIELFGQGLALPIILAPVGMAGMYARRGEALAFQAAAAAGVPFTLSTVSICDLEEIRAGQAAAPWFQLYVTKDRAFMNDALDRAERLGVTTLVLTVDMPVPGIRYRDRKTGLAAGSGPWATTRLIAQTMAHPRWCLDVGLLGRPHTFGTVAASAAGNFEIAGFWKWMGDNFDASITWKDLEALRHRWKGRLIVKGILDANDAETAFAVGADAIVVSNHGGRQLDGAQATIQALSAVRARVGPARTVLMDGGVRSGADIFRSLACGADGVMIGRPWVYALAAGGRRSVEALISDLARELALTMALAGVTEVQDIRRDCLV